MELDPHSEEQTARAAPTGLRAGQQIGPYRVVGAVGTGGMGRVYLAVRDGRDFRKRVALKVVRPSLVTGEVLRRFRQERQILAALDHPSIARLLDGGTTPDGRPYLVMEYVEGDSIVSYCEARRLPVGERLELFRTVCAAVHFAHQNLIVHRDIKPSNILVTPQGVPKLLDFGVAKLLNPELAADRLAPTRFDVRVMTPQYASPEQITGQPVTTATDVYALGVLLYELLTGAPPYRLAGRPLSEIARIVCDSRPPCPSSAARGGPEAPAGPPRRWRLGSGPGTRQDRGDRLARRLAGDLDNIVLMALRKEPARRYPSANQLSEDIARHIAGHPVVARPSTWRYRAGKFARRHRAGLAGAAAFVALLIAFGASMAAQSARLAAQRDRAHAARQQAEAAEGRAREEAETARQVSRFLVELFEVSDPDEARGSRITAREILDRGARKIERELHGQPLVQARLMHTIGNVHRSLGLLADAEGLLRKALETRRRLPGAEPLELAAVLSDLGEVQRQRGRFAEAEAGHRQALAIREEALGDGHAEVAASLNRLAIVYGAQARHDEAEPLLRRALLIRQDALGRDHPDTVSVLSNLAVLHAQQGRHRRAMPLFRRVLESRERALGSDHPDVGWAANNLARVCMLAGRHAEAEALYLRAIGILERSLGGEHPIVADTLKGLADLRVRQGRPLAAEPLFRRALAIREATLEADHPLRVENLLDFAALLHRLGRHEQAAQLERRAAASGGPGGGG